jgi:hypothetical protein
MTGAVRGVVCWLTNSIAKFVKWEHSHTTRVALSSLTVQFSMDQSPKPAVGRKERHAVQRHLQLKCPHHTNTIALKSLIAQDTYSQAKEY